MSVRSPDSNPMTVHLGTGSPIAVGTTVRDTFAALDAVPPGGTATWTHASARRAEAGFEDPTLGWIEVRASKDGGGVHASVVTGSEAAVQVLSGHMGGLNAYLAGQNTPIESLSMEGPGARVPSSSGEHFANQEAHAGMQPGLGQGMGQGTGQHGADGQQQASQQGAESPAHLQSVAAAALGPARASSEGPEDGSSTFSAAATGRGEHQGAVQHIAVVA